MCHTQAIYMMANQISLLGLASNQPFALLQGASYPQSPPIQIKCGTEGEKSPYNPVILAFNDTNDILSWRIPADEPRRFRYVNVEVQNKHWRWFGLYEDAGAAHSGYFVNFDQVWAAVACGINAQGKIPNCLK
jgi:hypothetical protein